MVGDMAVAEKIDRANRAQLSRELGMDRSFVSQVLSGKKGLGFEAGLRLSERLGVTAEELGEYLRERGRVKVGVGMGVKVAVVVN